MHHIKTGTSILLLVLAIPIFGQEPYFRLKDLDNNWKEYTDLQGSNLTVIDFWATWCHPCMKSIPLLDEIYREFQDQGVRFIGVSVDGTRNQSKIAPIVKSLGITYPIIRDIDSELMSDLGVSAVPTLLIYGPDGDQLFFHEGFRPGDEHIVRQQIEMHLEKNR